MKTLLHQLRTMLSRGKFHHASVHVDEDVDWSGLKVYVKNDSIPFGYTYAFAFWNESGEVEAAKKIIRDAGGELHD